MECNSIKIGTDFYATWSCSPIYIFLCTVLVTLPWLEQISYHFDDSRISQYTPILYARWSTFSDLFHNVSFSMQSHDQNPTLSLNVGGRKLVNIHGKTNNLQHIFVPSSTQTYSIHQVSGVRFPSKLFRPRENGMYSNTWRSPSNSWWQGALYPQCCVWPPSN